MLWRVSISLSNLAANEFLQPTAGRCVNLEFGFISEVFAV